jgi:hypothetical protein
LTTCRSVEVVDDETLELRPNLDRGCAMPGSSLCHANLPRLHVMAGTIAIRVRFSREVRCGA